MLDPANTDEEHTLSTDLQPPPLDEKEHHATVYIINLYAVKNNSGNTSEEMFENEIIENVPDILGKCDQWTMYINVKISFSNK